jgi:hypothetical protein
LGLSLISALAAQKVEPMRNCRKVALALATLVAVVLLAPATTSHAQGEQRIVNLSPGCNMTTLTFASGTEASALGSAVSPPTALQAVWRLDNTSRSFQAFMPQAPQASDLTSLNLLDAAFICVDAAATISMPTVAPDPAGAPISVNLPTGCSAVGLTFPDGTAPSGVAGAITPAEALESLWRLDNATGSSQAYVAAAPQASDLTSLKFLDAAFICMSGPAALAMPAVTAPAGGAAGGPSQDIRYAMEGAVPQVVDLPQGFEAVYESFRSFDPPVPQPGLLYAYEISYGNAPALLGDQPGTPFYADFGLVLFDTANHARGLLQDIASLSEENLEEKWTPAEIGLEINSLTVERVEALATMGEEANVIHATIMVRPVHTTTEFLPVAMDFFAFRRDRVIGEVIVMWPPMSGEGNEFIPQNLAKKMDAGIQEALPELLAAIK